MSTRTKRIDRIVKQLEKLADQADALDLTMPNGGEVGCLLMTMAFDIRQTNPPDVLIMQPPLAPKIRY